MVLAQVAIQIVNAMNKRALIHPQLAQRWREEASKDPEKVISEIISELKHIKTRKGQNRGI